jgi:hypothetical protein
MPDVSEQMFLEIGTIRLDWSEWVPWVDVTADNRGGAGVSMPNKVAGVYEVRCVDSDGDERIYIGKAGDLRLRVRHGLVKGKLPHPGGKRIREQEDASRLAIRWAVTDRPAAAEEELHRAYRARFGRLPLYTLNS